MNISKRIIHIYLFIELKAKFMDRSWNDFVGYWNWIKVFYIKIEQNPCSCHCIWAGWSRGRLQAHLGALPQPLLNPWGRPQSGPLRSRSQSSQSEFLSKVGAKAFLKTLNICPKPRDLDQDTNDRTHCANATFLTSSSGSNWRRGGWWHAGVASIIFLNCVSKAYF